jgi:prepilin-type processing-associated H-X9-DG protein
VEVFHCPADRGVEKINPPAWTNPSTYDYYGNSYPANGALFSHPWFPPIRLVEIRLPLSIVILAGDHQSVWAPRYSPYHAYWHDHEGLSMNVAFLDGHAEFLHFVRDLEQTGHYSFAIEWLEPEPPPKP